MGQTRLWRARSCSLQAWLGRKADTGRHICGFQTIWIVGPFLRKIQRAIDERMTVARHVGGEDADLAVRDLAGGTSVLPRHPARRLALLEKPVSSITSTASSSAKCSMT